MKHIKLNEDSQIPHNIEQEKTDLSNNMIITIIIPDFYRCGTYHQSTTMALPFIIKTFNKIQIYKTVDINFMSKPWYAHLMCVLEEKDFFEKKNKSHNLVNK